MAWRRDRTLLVLAGVGAVLTLTVCSLGLGLVNAVEAAHRRGFIIGVGLLAFVLLVATGIAAGVVAIRWALRRGS